jgi:hypothetical protein
MKSFKAWMEDGRVTEGFKNCKRLLLADGNSLSIQASNFHYCSPHTDLETYHEYEEFEVGFPSRHYELLEKFQDGSGDQTDSVFGWVPESVITHIIEESGGVVGFDVEEQK